MLRILLILGLLLGAYGPAWGATFQAGAAKTEITPPLGAPLNGYSERVGRGAVEVRDPIWARALFLGDEGTEVLLVSADLCVINPELRARALELAPPSVPSDNIILTATHNHSAQGGMEETLIFRPIMGRYEPDLLEATAAGLAEAMALAYENREEANIGYATGEQTDLTVNRREDDGPVDSQVGVIRVDRLDGEPLAVLANLAAHPTTVSGDDLYTVSADFPGHYYTALEESLGNSAVAMFLNGALGDQRATDLGGLSGWERTEGLGAALAEAVYAIAADIEGGEAALAFHHARPDLPPTLSPVLPRETIVQQLEIDGLILSFFPGEPCVDLGLNLREIALDAGYSAHFTVGLANDHLFYFAPRRYYTEPYYEQELSHYGPGIEDWFQRQFTDLMTLRPALPAPADPDEAVSEALPGGGTLYRVDGAPRAMGWQKGRAMAGVLEEAFATYISAPADERRVTPGNWPGAADTEEGAESGGAGWWGWLPGFIDVRPVALPLLAAEARPALNGVPSRSFAALEGMAAGSELAFDAAALLQLAPWFGGEVDGEPVSAGLQPWIVGVAQDRSASGGPVIAANLDWPGREPFPLWLATPEDGRAFAYAGLPWSGGAAAGMNEHGLAIVVAASAPAAGPPDVLPPELAVWAVLQTHDTTTDAVVALRAYGPYPGYTAMIMDAETGPRIYDLADDGGPARQAQDGLLLGAALSMPGGWGADRYGYAMEQLQDVEPIGLTRVEQLLQDAQAEGEALRAPLQADTRVSIIFDAEAAEVRVAFPNNAEPAPEYAVIAVGGGS